jgi:hypothetical protein
MGAYIWQGDQSMIFQWQSAPAGCRFFFSVLYQEAFHELKSLSVLHGAKW